MTVEINKYEYDYLKQSVTLQELAKKNGKSVKDMVREYCDVINDKEEA